MSSLPPLERLRAELLTASISYNPPFTCGTANGYARDMQPRAWHADLGEGTVVAVNPDGQPVFVTAADIAVHSINDPATLLAFVQLRKIPAHLVNIDDLHTDPPHARVRLERPAYTRIPPDGAW